MTGCFRGAQLGVRGTAIQLAVRIAVLVFLGIGGEAILVALLFGDVVLDAILDEAVLAGAAFAIDLPGVQGGDLFIGHFARAIGESRELFGVLLELFQKGCPSLRAVKDGRNGRMAILAAAHGQSPEKAIRRLQEAYVSSPQRT